MHNLYVVLSIGFEICLVLRMSCWFFMSMVKLNANKMMYELQCALLKQEKKIKYFKKEISSFETRR